MSVIVHYRSPSAQLQAPARHGMCLYIDTRKKERISRARTPTGIIQLHPPHGQLFIYPCAPHIALYMHATSPKQSRFRHTGSNGFAVPFRDSFRQACSQSSLPASHLTERTQLTGEASRHSYFSRVSFFLSLRRDGVMRGRKQPVLNGTRAHDLASCQIWRPRYRVLPASHVRTRVLLIIRDTVDAGPVRSNTCTSPVSTAKSGSATANATSPPAKPFRLLD